MPEPPSFGSSRRSAAAGTRKQLDSGRFPLLATIPAETASDLGGLFEYALARHLDGFAVLAEAAIH